MGQTSRGTVLLLWLLAALSLSESINLRAKRQASSGTDSLLTVEWEGIQMAEIQESEVKGFLVEYRAEKDSQWMVHSGIIPYKGPNHQYRVQIPGLPQGVTYFVRIKVLGHNNDVLIETPEIRARSEHVSIKCNPDQLTSPINLEATHNGQYSLAIKWDAPECGSIGEFQVELTGLNAPFDVHRQMVTHPHVSATNLLPGTTYSVRIRAIDRSRRKGPWSDQTFQAKTKGEPLPISPEAKILYRTDSELRVGWEAAENIQHYEIVAVEEGKDSRGVERTRVLPIHTSHALSGLRPNTKYLIGVIAFGDHEPRKVYRVESSTTETTPEKWQEKPQVVDQGASHYAVHWNIPQVDRAVHTFVLEYRLPNETHWRATDEKPVSPEAGDYSVNLAGIEGTPFYSVRVAAIDSQGRVISRTEEMTVGEAAEHTCVGTAGIPTDVRPVMIDVDSVRIEWMKPSCDETVAPIDGYEYLIHDATEQPTHDGASYVGSNGVTIKDLIPNAKYTFRVRSRSGNGHSPWSPYLQIATHLDGPRDTDYRCARGG